MVSTSGDGGPPDNARKFARYLKKKDGPVKGCLKDVRFCVLCLGDQNYERFCGFGVDVDVRLGELGGHRFMERGEADDGVGLEVVVEPWKAKFFAEKLPDVLSATSVSYTYPDAASAPMSPVSRNTTKRCFVATVKEGKLLDFITFQKTVSKAVVRGMRGYGVNDLTLFVVPGTLQVILTVVLASASINFHDTFLAAEAPYLSDPAVQEWEQASAALHGGWTACEELHSSENDWAKVLTES